MPNPVEKLSKAASAAIIATASAIPATIFFSKVFEFAIKSINPDRINISNDLAYLSLLLLVSMMVLIVMMAVATTLSIWTMRRREKHIGRIAVLTNILNVVFLAGTVVFTLLISDLTK